MESQHRKVESGTTNTFHCRNITNTTTSEILAPTVTVAGSGFAKWSGLWRAQSALL